MDMCSVPPPRAALQRQQQGAGTQGLGMDSRPDSAALCPMASCRGWRSLSRVYGMAAYTCWLLTESTHRLCRLDS